MHNPYLIILFEKSHIKTGTHPKFLSRPDLLHKYAGQQAWAVNGYNTDPRELYEIPEVRLYFRKLHSVLPGWLGWLDFNINQEASLTLILCSLPTAPTKTMTTTGKYFVDFDKTEFADFLAKDLAACEQQAKAGNLNIRKNATVAQALIGKALGIGLP
jgi:hypothetical protein